MPKVPSLISAFVSLLATIGPIETAAIFISGHAGATSALDRADERAVIVEDRGIGDLVRPENRFHRTADSRAHSNDIRVAPRKLLRPPEDGNDGADEAGQNRRKHE